MSLPTAKEELDGLFGEVHAELGETIVLHTSPFKCEVRALVDLPDQFGTTQQGQSQTIQGEVCLKEADATEVTVLTALTIRGAEFSITDKGLPDGGMVKLSVQREDREHTTVAALDPI